MPQSGKNRLVYWHSALLLVIAISCLIFYIRASRAASAMASELRQIGGEYITYTVIIQDTIPLYSDIQILKDVPLSLQMELHHQLPVHISQKIRDSFSLPVCLKINEVLQVDTSLALPDSLQLYAQGTIPVDQKFSLMGIDAFRIKTKAAIPLRQVLNAKLLHRTAYSSSIPVRLQVDEQIPVCLNLDIPIDQVIPVDIPIRSGATVSFPGRLSIAGYIPVKLEVPIKIPLSQTPLKQHLDKAADHLERMFGI